jgi:hypothetical protein
MVFPLNLRVKSKVKSFMEGKTIKSMEFSSYQSPNDSLVLCFTDETKIKIMSDPDMCFEGLAFFLPKTEVQETYERL